MAFEARSGLTGITLASGGMNGDRESLEEPRDRRSAAAAGDPIASGPVPAGEDESAPQQNLVRIVGTRGDDLLVGTARAEIILGLGGDDTLRGNGGDDQLAGGAGADALFGGGGGDALSGGAGDDRLGGGAGRDELHGNTGRDALFGDAGNDLLLGDAARDQLFGQRGDDLLRGGTAADRLDGGLGSDGLHGEDGDDELFGRAGADTLNGNAGDDVLQGGPGNDVMNGGADADRIVGGIDDDVLRGGAGADLLNGGAGSDVLDGGVGADELSGGPGADAFAFSALKGGLDRVTDFDDSSDRIDLSGLLPGFRAGDDLASFVRLTVQPSGTLLAVDRSGAGEAFRDLALLEDVALEHLTPEQLGLPGLARISPADLDGTNGVTLVGEDRGTVAFEGSVGGGDVDGDGLADIVIGRPADAADALGASFVVLGKALESVSSLALSGLDGANGFQLLAESPQDASGISVSATGDVDGDGTGDLIIGAPRTDIDGAVWAGRSYVVLGGPQQAVVDLADVAQGTGGFALDGIAASDQSGFSVSGAGDVNLDGLADLIVGAPFGGDQSGRSFVVFGKADHTPVDLGDVLAGSGGFAINGAQAEDWAGWPVSRAGDVNGDGAADVVVAAKLADPDGRDQAGASYVVFGKADPAPIDLGDVETGVGGFAIHGSDPNDGAGEAISGGGDINGDGLADLIVGAPNADPNDMRSAGESYVVFGKADGAPVELSAVAAGSGGFVIDGADIDDLSGLAVAVAGDVNGDGLDDLLVGAASADVRPPSEVSSGEAYVVYGKADGMPVNLSDVGAGVGGFVLVGEHGFDSLGRAVSGAGDVDGDGFADLVVDAPGAAETYVVFGGDFTGAVDRLGTAGDDTLSGTSADEVLMGAQGDDLLIGNGGLDVLNGGAGDDVLALIDPSLMEGTGGGGRLLGGSGIDTIRLEGSGAALDLTAIPDARIGGIETVDLGGGGNGLALDVGELLNLSDTSNTLTVLGEAGDRVGGALPGASVDTTSNPGFTTFAVGQAQLLVQTGIDTAGIDTTAA